MLVYNLHTRYTCKVHKRNPHIGHTPPNIYIIPGYHEGNFDVTNTDTTAQNDNLEGELLRSALRLSI